MKLKDMPLQKQKLLVGLINRWNDIEAEGWELFFKIYPYVEDPHTTIKPDKSEETRRLYDLNNLKFKKVGETIEKILHPQEEYQIKPDQQALERHRRMVLDM